MIHGYIRGIESNGILLASEVCTSSATCSTTHYNYKIMGNWHNLLRVYPTWYSYDRSLLVFAGLVFYVHKVYLIAQNLTSCSCKKASACAPCIKAKVANKPACIHCGATTVIELGAFSIGQPVCAFKI